MSAIERIHSKLTAVKAAALLEEMVSIAEDLAGEDDESRRREAATDLCVLIRETAVLLRKDIHDAPALDRVVTLCQETGNSLLTSDVDGKE